LAIYFSSKNFKVAIIYSDADFENNGIYVYGNPEHLRSLAARILEEAPKLGLLKQECIAAFNDKKGSCLFFEMSESINGRSSIEFKDELTEAVKYFKSRVNSEYELQKFIYTTEDPDGVLDIFFSEKASTFMVRVSNWPHLDFRIKKRYLGAFLDVMSSVSDVKIIGGGSSGITDKKTFAFIINSEGFGWLFKGMPNKTLLDNIFEKYADKIAEFTDEDADKYKISEQLINKINWLSSLSPFRW